MQRVTSILPSWDKTKTGSKKGFDKAWGWADKRECASDDRIRNVSGFQLTILQSAHPSTGSRIKLDLKPSGLRLSTRNQTKQREF